jgi:hypothetical protein
VSHNVDSSNSVFYMYISVKYYICNEDANLFI